MITKQDDSRDFHAAMMERQLSSNFSAADLCCAGETWERTRIWNEPLQQASWDALIAMCELILEPVTEHFGRPVITYGFASPELFKHIPWNTTKRLDQHVSCELNRNGVPHCARLGAAVDISVAGISTREIATWIADKLPFDRIYYYNFDRPLHVSIGPQNNRALVQMIPRENRLFVPRNRKLSWLSEE
jgi:hypothetical protein